MTETYDPVSHIAVIALIVFYWHWLRIWHQPPPSDRDRDTATRKPAAPQQLAAETDSQKGRSLRANARGTAISPAAQAEPAPTASPCNAPFDESSFLAGAAVAYERVLRAYIDEDYDVLEQLLDPALLAVFVAAISARKKRGERRELIFIGIRDMRTLQTRADPTMTTVTVRFVSEAVMVTYGTDGAVVDGHPQNVVQMTDDWSFARPLSSTDPNWQLVATGGVG
jgi:predicted lipid-binding transport protein (Tim44 family)